MEVWMQIGEVGKVWSWGSGSHCNKIEALLHWKRWLGALP